uniref:BTB domain-containing protein n=1 Tax=Panagrolaimus davidi TaxID=227884 RepID=A0A914QSM7_9BILA
MECEIATDWNIDEKDLRELEKDGCIDSKTVQTTIPGVEYYITAFLYHGRNGENVAFYLYVKTKAPMTGTFTFSIPSANFSQTLTCPFEGNVCNPDMDSYGEPFTTRQLFFDPKNRFFINGKLTLKLRGTLKCDGENGIKSGDTIGKLFYAKDDKDFTIEVDGEEIRAHKFILRERSPKFAAMFDSGKEEAIQNKVNIEGFSSYIVKAHKFIFRERSPKFAAMFDSGKKEAIQNKVKIEGFSADIVDEAIKICYDCEIKDCVIEFFSMDELLLLLKFSDVYDIAHVKTYAESYLADEITQNNVCRLANAAIEYRAEKLQLSCINSLIKYLKNATAVADFDSLDDAFKAKIATKGLCHVILSDF